MGETKPNGRQSFGFLITDVVPSRDRRKRFEFGSGYCRPKIPKAEVVK